MALPLKTTPEDLGVLTHYLRGQVGWVSVEKIRQSLASKFVTTSKLDAMRQIGLIERDGSNVKLTEAGREYATGDAELMVAALRAGLRRMPIYMATLEWMRYGKLAEPTRADVANRWHDKLPEMLDGSKGDGINDAVVFFMRLAEGAGLGKFVPAGNRRPLTLLRADLVAVESFLDEGRENGGALAADESPPGNGAAGSETPTAGDGAVGRAATSSAGTASPASAVPPTPAAHVATSPAVHINLEIHIAADAKAETVAEIFRNMRKYVLEAPAGGPDA